MIEISICNIQLNFQTILQWSCHHEKLVSQRNLDVLERRLKAKFVTSSKVKKFQNTLCHIMETLNT